MYTYFLNLFFKKSVFLIKDLSCQTTLIELDGTKKKNFLDINRIVIMNFNKNKNIEVQTPFGISMELKM